MKTLTVFFGEFGNVTVHRQLYKFLYDDCTQLVLSSDGCHFNGRRIFANDFHRVLPKAKVKLFSNANTIDALTGKFDPILLEHYFTHRFDGKIQPHRNRKKFDAISKLDKEKERLICFIMSRYLQSALAFQPHEFDIIIFNRVSRYDFFFGTPSFQNKVRTDQWYLIKNVIKMCIDQAVANNSIVGLPMANPSHLQMRTGRNVTFFDDMLFVMSPSSLAKTCQWLMSERANSFEWIHALGDRLERDIGLQYQRVVQSEKQRIIIDLNF